MRLKHARHTLTDQFAEHTMRVRLHRQEELNALENVPCRFGFIAFLNDRHGTNEDRANNPGHLRRGCRGRQRRAFRHTFR